MLLIYIPRGIYRARNWHLLSHLEGCQRVIEPDLSPLLYKSKPFAEVMILVSLPNIVANIRAYLWGFQI